jgi:hypothetical protein
VRIKPLCKFGARNRFKKGEMSPMEESEMTNQPTIPAVGICEGPLEAASATGKPAIQTLPPQVCPTCGAAAASAPTGRTSQPSYVYAIGRIEHRFPRLSVEKEFARATGRADTKGQTDRQALHSVLSKSENRYLARQLCWVLTIEGLETYILIPRDPADIGLLVDALRPNPTPADLDVVVGVMGPIAPPEMCNGLLVPILAFDQIYSFDRDTLIKAIPRPEKTPPEKFAAAAEELFDRIMQMADNAGAMDEHRALNYCAVRYPAIYAKTLECFDMNSSLSALEVRPSPLSGVRRVLDVIFSYTNRNTDVVEKYYCRTDVAEEFPFLVTKLSPYYDR